MRKKNINMNLERLLSKFTNGVNMKYPAAKEYAGKQMAIFGRCADAIKGGKLWYVNGKQSLARQGEKLASPETGKFLKFAFLEEIDADAKGSRIHVKRVRGKGPDQGWVSPKVKDTEILKKITELSQVTILL